MATGNGTSLAKIEANRQNAQKSTGPKSQEGKEKSKMNALKHGLVAQATVIPAGEAKESDTEFTQLLDLVMEEFEPQSFIEEMLTERIAICYWRLRRAAYAEVGEIRKSLDTVKGETSEEDTARFLTAKFKCEQTDEEDPDAVDKEALDELQNTAEGLEFLIALLNDARSEFENKDKISEPTHFNLTMYLDYSIHTYSNTHHNETSYAEGEKPKLEYEENPLYHAVVNDLEALSAKKAHLEEKRRLQHEINVIRSAIPFDVNRIVRYETTIERQLYKALDKLTELQRRRKAKPQD